METETVLQVFVRLLFDIGILLGILWLIEEIVVFFYFIKSLMRIFYLKTYYTYEIPNNYLDVYLTPTQVSFFCTKNISYDDYGLEIKCSTIMSSILYYIYKGYITVSKIRRNDDKISYRISKNNLEVFRIMYCIIPDDKTKQKMKEYQISMIDIFIMERIVFNQYNHIVIEKLDDLYVIFDKNMRIGNFETSQIMKTGLYEFVELGLCYSMEKMSKKEKRKFSYNRYKNIAFLRQNKFVVNEKRFKSIRRMD